MSKLTDNEKKGIVDSLISDCECWEEGDRETLNAMADAKLQALSKHVTEHMELVANKAKVDEAVANASKMDDEEEEEEEEEVAAKNKKKPTANRATKPRTTDQWLAEAPAEVQSVVRNAMAAEAAQKAELIEQITANERNVFTKEHLQMKDVMELKAIAALAVQEDRVVPLYLGSPGAPPTRNVKGVEEEPLLLPTVNWQESA